jgi:hypothetical protein
MLNLLNSFEIAKLLLVFLPNAQFAIDVGAIRMGVHGKGREINVARA